MRIKSSIIVIGLLSIMLLSMFTLALLRTNESEPVIACDLKQDKTIYIAVGETYQLDENEYISNDSSIAEVIDNEIIGIENGETIIEGQCYRYTVNVSNLYTAPVLNNNKDFLLCRQYSVNENKYLDEVLKYEINNAQYHSRASVVEAARFLTLRFKYKLNYFYENGRLLENDDDIAYVDGEGRYYHEGLYLNKFKTEQIKEELNGPDIWGCPIYESHRGDMINNSLDCSGFISWAMLNAGYDIGDIGSGIDEERFDFTDVGEKVEITQLDTARLKVGDLVGFDGHIGILLGDDGTNYYVAHMYWEGDLQVSTYSYNQFKNCEWEYVILMDNYYQDDGNLTNYWN